MKLAHVIWRDASHGVEEIAPAEGELATLEEVGFLWHEDDEKVTLTMEQQEGQATTRLWLSIPRQNIITMQVRDLRKAFPKPRKASTTTPALEIAQ